MKEQTKNILSLTGRIVITVLAFAWILQLVDLSQLKSIFAAADHFWLAVAVGSYFTALIFCIFRWRFLVPEHPALTLGFLTNSFFVACLFNTILPTTIGGDVIRGYDLIKATGKWRESLASIFLDRMIGLVGFLFFALLAWAIYPAAREDPFILNAFIGYCILVIILFGVLGSKRMLTASLKPFGKIGLGSLSSHAKQFQETLLDYRHKPKQLAGATLMSLGVQLTRILMFIAVVKAFALPVPILFLMLVVPIIMLVTQIPLSLNGLGIREIATIQFLARVDIGASEATAVSLVCSVIPFLSAIIGAVFLLTRQKKKKPKPEN